MVFAYDESAAIVIRYVLFVGEYEGHGVIRVKRVLRVWR